MIEVSNIRAHSLDLDRVDLSWEINDTLEDHLLFTLSVQRSESISGPWDTLVRGLKDVWFFSDTTLPRRRVLRTVFYRLSITEDSSGDTEYSEPVRIAPDVDLVGKEIARRLSLLLREFTGRWIILYPVRTFGTRCPHCWDSVRKRITRDFCPSCFGTGYAGGYMRPIKTLMQINRASQDVEAPTKYGRTENRIASGITWNYPPLKDRDVIIEKENLRWEIKVVDPTERLRAIIQQRVTLAEISPHNILYKLNPPIDPSEFQASPYREFVRSTDISHVGDGEIDLGSMLRVFGVRGPR